MSTLVNQSANGSVFKCNSCNKIHIEYKNLNFNFDQEEYEHFVNYISKLDGKKWEAKNKNQIYNRKIIISIQHKTFNILLHNYELLELKQLLQLNSVKIPVFQQIKIQGINIRQCCN